MTHHVHLAGVPERPDAFARGLQRCHSRWAQRLHRQYSRSRHLWQGRFFSCALDRDHLTRALAYVDLHPVRAGRLGDAPAHPWSSAVAHAAGRDSRGMLDLEESRRTLERQIRGHERWADVGGRSLAESSCRAVCGATYAGLPLGKEAFVRRLERQFGRRLRIEKPGRKAKASAAAQS